ncbi:F0F1 ATP synthase subunit A [Mycoplasma zalophi]|uniref:F0F1 ATP synthase subunit A n=1 Tax=Mycoplasma zalophi TaxID=191287 RepID=UPI001C123B70|nr:F0F1 ATP synthase subunit A [Mycoplasma zalophi]MBU4691010.1 F0F1 ATP synthase subunit A [Mycoplasma zalophi]
MDRLFGHSSLNDKSAWGNSEFSQNPLVSLVLLTIMITLMAIALFIVIKRSKTHIAPPKVVIVVEQYIMFIDDLTNTSSEGKLDKTAPYFFSLFTFLSFGNALSIFGLAPIANSLTFVFSVTAITWIGTIFVGIIFQRWRYIKEWLNPMDWIGKLSPILSLSFRMFGNVTGGTLLIILLEALLNYIWRAIFGFHGTEAMAQINIISILLLPWLSLYFDIFDSVLQAFVFVILSLSYWSLSAKVTQKEKSKEIVINKMKNIITN